MMLLFSRSENGDQQTKMATFGAQNKRGESRVQQRTNQSGSILASNYTFDIKHYIMMFGFYFLFLANNRFYDKSFIKK